MNDKKRTKKSVSEIRGSSPDIKTEQISRLKQLLPEAFSEGKLDVRKLKLTLGEFMETEGERYHLDWAGKSEAFAAIQTPTSATLAPEPSESVNFDDTQNVFIEGENLEVLKALQKSYHGKIKMIYIDPPYNTGNDSFIYPDKFSESKDEYLKRIEDKDESGYLLREGFFRKNSKENGHYHSNWLSMMYPRLFLARNLLRDDGVIFVSIDDNEVHNLRLMMNEIFGEENFVAQISWKGRGGRQDSTHLAEIHEYILLYAKAKEEFSTGGMIKEDEVYPKYDAEKKLHYKTQLARKWGSNSRREDRPNLYYSVPAPDGKEVFPKLSNDEDGCWRWSKLRMNQEIREKNVEFIKEDKQWIVYEKIYEPETGEEKTKKFTTWLDDVGSSSAGTKELQNLFQEKSPFSYPKPTNLLKRLMSIADIYSDDIILDFFAGSGTTAHAVLDLNKEDGGTRKFICVQLPEKTGEESEAFKAGYKTIADISKERIRRVIKKIKEEEKQLKLEKKELDLGFKVFKLRPSNFKLWRGDTIENGADLEKQLDIFKKPVKPAAAQANILCELIIKSGYDLTAKIEKRKPLTANPTTP